MFSNGRIKRFDIKIQLQKDNAKNASSEWKSIPVTRLEADSGSSQGKITVLKQIQLPVNASVKMYVTAINSVGKSPEASLFIHEKTNGRWPQASFLRLKCNIYFILHTVKSKDDVLQQYTVRYCHVSCLAVILVICGYFLATEKPLSVVAWCFSILVKIMRGKDEGMTRHSGFQLDMKQGQWFLVKELKYCHSLFWWICVLFIHSTIYVQFCIHTTMTVSCKNSSFLQSIHYFIYLYITFIESYISSHHQLC